MIPRLTSAPRVPPFTSALEARKVPDHWRGKAAAQALARRIEAVWAKHGCPGVRCWVLPQGGTEHNGTVSWTVRSNLVGGLPSPTRAGQAKPPAGKDKRPAGAKDKRASACAVPDLPKGVVAGCLPLLAAAARKPAARNAELAACTKLELRTIDNYLWRLANAGLLLRHGYANKRRFEITAKGAAILNTTKGNGT